jgi:hypothetical protein
MISEFIGRKRNIAVNDPQREKQVDEKLNINGN